MADKLPVKNRIKAVGVELEGGWNPTPLDFPVTHDGSVNFEDIKPPRKLTHYDTLNMTAAEVKTIKAELEQWRRDNLPQTKGEIPSPPLAVEKVGEFMLKYYPRFVNKTCGLHVHMSFAFTINYQRLMVPEFTTDMVKGLVKWAEAEDLPKKHPIWERITQEDHPHCAHVYLGDGQTKVNKKDYHSRGTTYSRYTAINYCYGQHKTVECRLLPMFETADQGIRAVYEVLDITNRFLAKQRQKEVKVEGKVRRTGNVIQSRRLYV